MSGEKVHKEINENITFQYLDGDENSLWSLLLSVGYIKAENVVHKVDTIECDVSVTNKEVMAMFRTEILGLIVTLRDRYRIVSNRESGRGRYDIAMYPLEKNQDAFLMEFKVWDKKKEKSGRDSRKCVPADRRKKYVTDLVTAGINEERIYKLGFAFAGKEVLVKEKI